MSYREMAQAMQMDDRARVGKVLFDQLEWQQHADGAWDASASYGGDYNKVLVRTEGERIDDTTRDAHADVYWDRIVARWWNLQLGARQDFGLGPDRTWAAVGISGIAPYWFDLEATAYVGDRGRTAARLKAEYDMRFTQRLILRPEAELNAYGKSDAARGVGSGIADLSIGLRMRYEIRREFAPYVGVVWRKRFGETATLAREAGEDPNELRAVAGLRVWF
jgi:copper resistance protein B